MKKLLLVFSLTLLALSGTASAAPGYLTSSNGEIARNSYNECWRTSTWEPEYAVAGCDQVKKTKAEKPAEKPKPVMSVTLEATPLFDFDKSNIKSNAQKLLEKLIVDIRKHGNINKITVVGHADRIGTEKYNDVLSMKRAKEVKAFLVAKEAKLADLITVDARGESEQIKACSESLSMTDLIRCLAPNRRVEISAF